MPCRLSFFKAIRGSTPDRLQPRGLRQKASRPGASVILPGAYRAWQAGNGTENADTFSNLSNVIRPPARSQF
ncbi:hypothetical protein C7U60_19255 [Mesorhizobium plurifarium]|nr:hypothetical protein C7U60_19255 [Mesorhizobium plurifarium]